VIARLHGNGHRFTLDVVGDGHLKPSLEQRARELGIEDVVRWHPPSLEMARWYRSADLLLMTSVFEGVPYVIYESLSMGVPVVAPALPGNVEFMDADSGVLVDPRDDAAQYEAALARLLGDPDERRRMGERSRERMLRDFSLREMAARHEELYDRLLARRTASARARHDVPAADELTAGPASPPPPPLSLPRSPLPERSVGVIVPCHRHGLYLADCLDSIRAQTLPAAHVVVVDDGSDDPETHAALDAAERDGFAQVIRQPENRGPSAARNRALQELETSYVLPLDADDLLLPDALEQMVAQLEAAPPEVGFIYPNAQHFGNRDDYVRSPAYNLYFLLVSNYCPATSLFDRRVFEAGVAYDEGLVLGHEDWDLVLQLGERGVIGEVAAGPTFLYRRRGFSRVNAVEYGPEAFDEAIKMRHRGLYRARRDMKARWAPALSVLAVEEAGGERWQDGALAGLIGQTCPDFELVHPPHLTPPAGIDARAVPAAGSPEQWLADALAVARGRWILAATPEVDALVRRRTFVEQLLNSFVASQTFGAIALGRVEGGAPQPFRQIAAEMQAGASLHGVAWERPWQIESFQADIGVSDSLLEDLLYALSTLDRVMWRRLPEAAAPAPAEPSVLSAEVGG
jgi:hypothetical protein